MRTMVERWIAFVVDEGNTNKKNKKRKKAFESVLHAGREERGGWRTEASDKGSLYAYVIRTRTPFARANRLRFARSSRHSNNRAPGCLLTPIRDAIETCAERLSENIVPFVPRGSFMDENDDRPFQLLNINRSSEIVFTYCIDLFFFSFETSVSFKVY